MQEYIRISASCTSSTNRSRRPWSDEGRPSFTTNETNILRVYTDVVQSKQKKGHRTDFNKEKNTNQKVGYEIPQQ